MMQIRKVVLYQEGERANPIALHPRKGTAKVYVKEPHVPKGANRCDYPVLVTIRMVLDRGSEAFSDDATIDEAFGLGESTGAEDGKEVWK